MTITVVDIPLGTLALTGETLTATKTAAIVLKTMAMSGKLPGSIYQRAMPVGSLTLTGKIPVGSSFAAQYVEIQPSKTFPGTEIGV